MSGGGGPPSPIVEVGVACMALAGADDGFASGDLHVVAPFDRGALVAVIDGLGHGSEAARASRAAADVLASCAGQPVADLIALCHEELRRTRGAVMSLVQFDARDSSARWAGVGNVEAILLRRGEDVPRRDTIPMRAGVVGYSLPPVHAHRVSLSRGDTIVMATDGLHRGFASDLALERSPQELADAILARDAKGTDDALVVVTRYLGSAP